MIPTIKFACVEFLHCVHIGYHGLHGSTSPVLMVTGFVNRKWQFSMPYRIDTPQPITKKFVKGDYASDPTVVPNLVHIRGGVKSEWVDFYL